MIGNLAISKAGHDKLKRYIIIEESDDFVYLADGNIRTLSNPKKKRKKHIQPIYKYNTDELKEKIINKSVTDEQIKRVIKISLRAELSEEE